MVVDISHPLIGRPADRQRITLTVFSTPISREKARDYRNQHKILMRRFGILFVIFFIRDIFNV